MSMSPTLDLPISGMSCASCAGRVERALQALPGVAHIALVGGDFDVLMLVRAPDNAALRRLVLDRIHAIEGVVNTRTLLVFEEPDVPGLQFATPD